MRYFLLLIAAVSLFASCENRDCACENDIKVDWNDEELAEAVYILTSNAVLNVGLPFAMDIGHRDPLTNPQDPKWELRSIKISKGGDVFENTTSTSTFVSSGSIIEIPHDVFDSYTDGLITGAVSLDMELFFQEFNATARVSGSVYYYSCEVFGKEDFGLEDCRWPNQIVNAYVPIPC